MSTYETIGGETAVSEAVDRFDQKLMSDPDISVFFESTDMKKLGTLQRMFLTAALGGPDAYEGRDMRAAHAHLRITDADFDAFLDHLAETLVEIGTSTDRIDDVLGALKPLRLEIVSAAPEGTDEWGASEPVGGSG
jgi:hemoglobin